MFFPLWIFSPRRAECSATILVFSCVSCWVSDRRAKPSAKSRSSSCDWDIHRIPGPVEWCSCYLMGRFQQQQQKRRRPLRSSSEPIGSGGWSPVSVAHQSSLGCKFPGSGLVNQGNVVSVVAAVRSCWSFMPTDWGTARLSRPTAIACKFPAYGNYAVTQVSSAGFEPGTEPTSYESSVLPLGHHELS